MTPVDPSRAESIRVILRVRHEEAGLPEPDEVPVKAPVKAPLGSWPLVIVLGGLWAGFAGLCMVVGPMKVLAACVGLLIVCAIFHPRKRKQ